MSVVNWTSDLNQIIKLVWHYYIPEIINVATNSNNSLNWKSVALITIITNWITSGDLLTFEYSFHKFRHITWIS
jgi:hypothetical protein